MNAHTFFLPSYCTFSVKHPNYRHFSFLLLLACQAGPNCQARDVKTTLDGPQRKLHTEESGQDCVRWGLHLEHTPPEEALVVQRERRKRAISDDLHRLDLNETNRQTDISRRTERRAGVETADLGFRQLCRHVWRPLSSALALCDSALQWCHGIKRGSDYGPLVCEVFQGGKLMKHAWVMLSICLSEIWLMALNNAQLL